MELLRIFIAAVMVFQFGLVAANNLPPILISGNESVYPGESVVFECHVDTTGIDLVTFQWVRIDGENATFFNETVDMETSGDGSADDGNYFFNSTLNVTDVNYTDNDVGYYCNASGCNVSMTAYLTVLSPMIMSFTPAPQLLLEVNESGSLVCNALGGPRLVITIERDGSVFENGTMGDDIVEYNFTANNETFGNYTCTAMIDDMEMNESTLVVVAPYGVTIAADSGEELIQRPAVVEYGDTLTLTCSTSGGPDNMFSWSKDNMVIIESNILSISPVTPAEGGEYQCMVSNDAGNSTANITIYVAPQFVLEPENVEMLIGSAVNLSCSANGFPAPDITWSFQGMPFNNNIVNSTTSTYSESTIVITDLMLSNGGTYSCSINSDAIAMPNTSEANVTVIGEMVMGLMNMLVFPGESASWDCQVQSTIPLQFMWYRNGMLVQNTTGSLMGGNRTSSSYMLTNVSYDYNASNVTCSATGSVLTVNSSEAAYLTVLLPNITGITIVPTPSAGGILLHQFNNGVSLTCTAEGGPRIMTRWQFDDGSSVANGSSSVTYNVSSLSTDDAGVYYCEAIIDGMTDTSMNYTLFVAPYDVMIMGENLYNQGDSLMLDCSSEGGPELEYIWLFSGNIIANTSILVIDNVSTIDGGDYTCNVTNAAGSDNEDITVYIAPYDVMIMGENVYDQGDSLMLNCSSEGGPELNYSWLFEENIIADTGILVIDNVNTTHGGDYTCNVTNAAGANSNNLTVYIAPYDVNIIGIRRYPFGSGVELNCTSEGGPQLEYSWIFSNCTVDNDSMLMRDGIVANGGNYTCNVTNNAGFDSSTTTVYIGPRFVTDPVDSQEVVINGTFTLTCVAEGFPTPAIIWFMNNTMISNGVMSVVDMAMNVRTSTLTISNASFSDSGMYYCEAESSEFVGLNVTSGIANIAVVERPVVIAVRPNVTLGENVTFDCNEFGSPPFSYQWYMRDAVTGDDILLVNETEEFYNITSTVYNDTGEYFCEASNSLGVFSNSTPVQLLVRPSIVEHPVMQMVYPGVTVSFSCRAEGFSELSYSWFVVTAGIGLEIENETNTMYTISNPMYNENATGYYCIVSNNEGIAVSNTSMLTVLLPNITGITIAPTPSAGGTLLHQFNDTVSLTCTAEGGPRIMTRWQFDNGSTVADDGSSVTYDVSSLSTDDTGVYYCETIIDGMSVTSVNYTLFVAPYEVEIMGIDMYPQGERLMLTCLSEGGPELNYSWLFEGSVIANTSILVIDNVSATDGGDYICNVTNAAGSDSENITVYIGVVITTHPQDELVNVSGSVNFTCEASGSSPINYRWLYNGSYIMNDPGHIEGVNTSTLLIVNVNVTDWGLYSCEASNIVDNITSNGATLYVSPLGTVDVTPNDIAVDHMTNSVTFTCQSMAGPNLNYTWLINGSSEALNNADIVVNDFQLTVNNVTYLLGGRYTCVVSNMAGQGEDSSDLFVNPLIITDPESQLALEGDIVNFTCTAIAFPAPLYNWSTPIPDTDFNISTITILVDFFYYGNYTCFAESNGTIATSLPALLTVSPEGSVEILPINITTTFNSTVTITCFADGGPNNMFEWSKNGTEVVSNNSVLEFQMITGSDGAVYECTVSNAAGNETRNVTLTVAPYNATITQSNVTYTCNAEGGPGNTYKWLRLRDNETVSMTQELTLDNTDPLDGGDYQCAITNTAGNTSAMITLNVATVIVTSPQTQNVTAGESFTLLCNATGYPVPSIEWTLNGTSYIIEDPSIATIMPLEGLRSNSSNLTVTSAMTNDTGIYECVATNVVNNDTQDANVTVQNCPDEPINVQIFNVNSRNLTINWTEPHANNDPITQYSISYQNPDCLVDANNVTQNVTVTSMEEQVTINNLHPGEYYTFTIIAINDICPSQPSLPASMRTEEEVPGAAPVVSTNASQRSINVSWMMLECQDRRGNITMYEVRYASTDFGDNVDQTLTTSSGAELSLEVDGLEEFTNYTIEVRAYTAIGPGPYSTPINVRTLPDIPSGPVNNLTAMDATPTSVNLSWNPVNERDQNGIILSYNIYYRLSESSGPDMMILDVIGRSRTVGGLMENEVYVFAVTAVNQVGESMVNASVMIQTNESAPSTPPVNVMIFNVTDSNDIAVNITWSPPTDPNGIIRYYRIEFVEALDPLDNGGQGNTNCPPLDNNTVMNMFANITSGSNGAPTITRLNGLVAYRMYRFSIFAATSVGEGPSADGSFLTREDTPLPPKNLTVEFPLPRNSTTRNSTTLVVNWKRPFCDRGVLSGYELCYVESSVGDCDSNGTTVDIIDPDQLSYTINDLSINTNYTVEVRGRTGAGLGDPASANGTTDEDAPDLVMNLTAQFSPNNTTRGIYTITWTPPAPANGSFYQILEYSYSSAYDVGPTYNGSFSTEYLELDQSQNEFIFDALYYTDYSFTITTNNTKYNISNGPSRTSSQSPSAVPTAVRNIRVEMSTSESIYIAWDHPEYPNSQLLNYNFYYNDNPAMLQSGSEKISTNGFEEMTLEIVTSYNLTGLSSFTNYTILITVTGRNVSDDAPFEVEILHRTNSSVPDDPITPPPTTTPLPPPNTDTITVLLPPPAQINTGIVDVYAVIVVTGDELRRAPRARRNTDNPLRSPSDIISDNNGEFPGPYNASNPMDLYTTAVWTNPDDVPLIFVVGNGSRTTGPDGTVYVNAELDEGTEYGVFDYIRLESDDGVSPGRLLVDDDYLAVTSTRVTPAEDSNAGAIAAGVIIPLIVIAAIIVGVIVFIWYYRRRRYTKHDLYTGEVAYTESENVVLNPVAPQPYLGTFQPIPVTEFKNHVNKMHADSDYRFSEEYAETFDEPSDVVGKSSKAVEPEHSPTTEATLAPSNTNKNRYANISAYDHSRVRLRVQSEDETDYINANYIDGYKRKNAYIATQGPVPDTFISFWRMIWECESQTIVMLTNLEEKGRVKCHQYWPDDKVKVPGNIRVATLEQLELAEYTVRTFSLKREGSKEERIVKQFHYTTWPDFGVPTHPTPVLRFTRRILTTDHQDAGPIIVHCSAGVGRSGTFITLHSQLQRISAEGTIDIFPFVRQMRYRRCHMVQTEPQYVFIHDALLEAIECGETEVAARDLKAQYRKLSGPSDDDHKKQLIEEEFKRIDDSIHISGDHTSGQTPANKAKNRYANVLPYDGSRCRISAIPGQEGSDYINASYIDGYLKQKAYVATQGPLPDTAAEFWRMIWELKCATIVMLVKEREQGRVKCHHYWPDTGAETFGQYQVVAHSCNEYAEYTLREFKLVDKKDNSSLPVRHFQFTSWPENGTVPENSSGLIDLIGQVQKWQQNSGNKPITVHCSGGSGRTGTYIAISILLDRLKVEGVVDVFQTVRGLRLQRMHMVQTLAQYEFCYTTILEFLDSFELYSNFK